MITFAAGKTFKIKILGFIIIPHFSAVTEGFFSNSTSLKQAAFQGAQGGHMENILILGCVGVE